MIFVDSSAIIALSDRKDEFFLQAIDWRNLHRTSGFCTSNIVFIESMGWIRHKRGKRLAVQTGNNILFGSGISVERVRQDDEVEAWQLFNKVDGRGLSMVDCTTLILMKRLKIKEIFTFDSDFKKFGFKVYP